MSKRPVHWHEGMFLRPQHFQAAQRHALANAFRDEKWDHQYNWGLRAIDLDREALANHRFVVRSLEARFRDGTLVVVPEDGVLPALDLRPAFGRESALTVHLALPVLRVGRANTGEGSRFLVDRTELEDENTGDNPQPVDLRLLNFTLRLSNENQTGYETLPIARVRKADRPEAAPDLDVTYIPPVLACDAWLPLANGILQGIYDRIGTRLNRRAEQVRTRNVSIGSNAPGDVLLIDRLRALNEAHAVLGVLTFAEGVHPLSAYLELCRLVGQLAIYTDARRVPDLPRYDHDDLAGCFYRVKEYLDRDDPDPDYIDRPFDGVGPQLQVKLERDWLDPGWQMYVGVQTTLPVDQCVKLLTRQGQLDMKIGSSDRVEGMYQLGYPSLRFAHAPLPPRALPGGPLYFQVDRTSVKEEWQYVQNALQLAIRLNPNYVDGTIQGQRVTVRPPGLAPNTLAFTLYVMRPERSGAAAP
jgi:type VI secretion system protein ImpJ